MKTVYVIIYSAYGHIEKMARRMAVGIEKSGNKAKLFQVQETLSEEILEKMRVKKILDIPFITPKEMPMADGFLFGFPTRFGMVPAQIKALLDSCGKLWVAGALKYKPVGTFVSTGSLGFGQEGTHLSLIPFFAHHGMVYVPFGSKCQSLFNLADVHGGSPYGSGTLSGSDNSRYPTDLELEMAEFQGSDFGQFLNLMK